MSRVGRGSVDGGTVTWWAVSTYNSASYLLQRGGHHAARHTPGLGIAEARDEKLRPCSVSVTRAGAEGHSSSTADSSFTSWGEDSGGLPIVVKTRSQPPLFGQLRLFSVLPLLLVPLGCALLSGRAHF